MPDLTEKILPQLRALRLKGLDLGSEVVHPFYQGASILNIPTSISLLLDAPPLRAESLLQPILDPLGSGIRRILLVLVDALALHRLQRWMADGTAPIWKSLCEAGILAPLTSVVPSTTSTCLPTLWTGLSPAEHGMVGYELWLKEYGVVANMIKHTPFTVKEHPAAWRGRDSTPRRPFPTRPWAPTLKPRESKPTPTSLIVSATLGCRACS